MKNVSEIIKFIETVPPKEQALAIAALERDGFFTDLEGTMDGVSALLIKLESKAAQLMMKIFMKQKAFKNFTGSISRILGNYLFVQLFRLFTMSMREHLSAFEEQKRFISWLHQNGVLEKFTKQSEKEMIDFCAHFSGEKWHFINWLDQREVLVKCTDRMLIHFSQGSSHLQDFIPLIKQKNLIKTLSDVRVLLQVLPLAQRWDFLQFLGSRRALRGLQITERDDLLTIFLQAGMHNCSESERHDAFLRVLERGLSMQEGNVSYENLKYWNNIYTWIRHDKAMLHSFGCVSKISFIECSSGFKQWRETIRNRLYQAMCASAEQRILTKWNNVETYKVVEQELKDASKLPIFQEKALEQSFFKTSETTPTQQAQRMLALAEKIKNKAKNMQQPHKKMVEIKASAPRKEEVKPSAPKSEDIYPIEEIFDAKKPTACSAGRASKTSMKNGL